jgi:hypothetical protein
MWTSTENDEPANLVITARVRRYRYPARIPEQRR